MRYNEHVYLLCPTTFHGFMIWTLVSLYWYVNVHCICVYSQHFVCVLRWAILRLGDVIECEQKTTSLARGTFLSYINWTSASLFYFEYVLIFSSHIEMPDNDSKTFICHNIWLWWLNFGCAWGRTWHDKTIGVCS